MPTSCKQFRKTKPPKCGVDDIAKHCVWKVKEGCLPLPTPKEKSEISSQGLDIAKKTMTTKTKKTKKTKVSTACQLFEKPDLVCSICRLEYPKIAGFDLDHTLIKPHGKRIHPKDENDWEWLYPDAVVSILEILHASKHTICIFSNQSPKKISTVLLKIEQLKQQVNAPLNFFFSIKNDHYRKPRTGMWQELAARIRPLQINLQHSFFCGDAATDDDFAKTDYQFAANVGVRFVLPQQVFAGAIVKLPPLSNDFLRLHTTSKPCGLDFLDDIKQPIAVIQVGRPSSGKSTFSSLLLEKGFSLVSNDAKTTMTTFKRFAKEHKNIVIDNTSPSKESRAKYIPFLQENDYHIICVWFHIPEQVSHFLNQYRIEKTSGAKSIPMVVYHTYNKKFQQPTLDEGFEKIVEFTKICGVDDDSPLFNYYF